MAGSLFSMGNLARIAKVIALLLFVLPWVTISCAEQPLITMSGVDLATGHVMMHNPMTGATESPPGANGGDIWVILAAVLILAGLAATFILKGKKGLIADMAGAALAAAALAYTVLVRIPQEAHAGTAGTGAGGPAASGGPSPEQIAQMIHIDVQIGFWLTLLALVAAIVFDFLAMKKAAPAAYAATPAPPPPAEPPPPSPPDA
ncbi:MAG TPA: hypothetical protein VGW40_15710 [Allosphingosinicella sp.]|nr:hypothetical protein [Allosphingosinicella sp.]